MSNLYLEDYKGFRWGKDYGPVTDVTVPITDIDVLMEIDRRQKELMQTKGFLYTIFDIAFHLDAEQSIKDWYYVNSIHLFVESTISRVENLNEAPQCQVCLYNQTKQYGDIYLTDKFNVRLDRYFSLPVGIGTIIGSFVPNFTGLSVKLGPVISTWSSY